MSSRRLRILLSVCGFPPAANYGGPAVSLDNLTRLLCGDADFFVLTRDHDKGETRRLEGIHDGWNDRNGVRVRYLPSGEFSLDAFRRVTAETAPDLVYLNSLFSADFVIPLMKAAREAQVPILLAPRGELCTGALAIRRLKKLAYLLTLGPWLRGENVFWHATSSEEAAAIRARIGDDAAGRIFQITETPTLPDWDEVRKIQPLKQKGFLRCVFLSRIHPIKNLRFALEALRGMSPGSGGIGLDIYGPPEDADYWSECQRLIASMPAGVQVLYRGSADHGEVHRIFAAHDVFVFPTQSENYGHVVPEALSAGCPVILSQGTTPWDGIEAAGAGRVISLSHPELFTRAIQELAAMDGAAFGLLRRNARRFAEEQLNPEESARAYLRCFEQVASAGTGREFEARSDV